MASALGSPSAEAALKSCPPRS